MTLWKVYFAILLVTVTEGGIDTIYPPYLQKSQYALDQIGWIVALFGVTQLAARWPAGVLYGADRAKLLCAAFLALHGVSTAGLALAGGMAYLVTLTLLHGFAFGGITTVMFAWIIELKPANSSHGVSMGWYTAALSAGYSIGNFAGGYLADHWSFALVFLALGVLPFLSLLICSTLPAFPRSTAPSSAQVSQARKRWAVGDLRAALTQNLILATLIAFYLNVLDDGFSAFFPLFGLSIGLSLTFIGLLKSVKSLTATGLRPMSGIIFRRVNIKKLNNTLIVAWALAMVMLPSLREPWMFAGIFVVAGICRGLLRVTSATMVAEEKTRDAQGIGIASGLYNAGLDVGAFVGPLVAGWVAALTGIPTMFRIVPLALLAVYFLTALGLDRTRAAQTATPVTGWE